MQSVYSRALAYWAKTVLFQADQLSISKQFYLTHRPGATTLGQSGPGRKAIKGYSTFFNAPASLEIHHQIVCVIARTSVRGVLTLCRDVVGVFYRPSQLGQHRHMSSFVSISVFVCVSVCEKISINYFPCYICESFRYIYIYIYIYIQTPPHKEDVTII